MMLSKKMLSAYPKVFVPKIFCMKRLLHFEMSAAIGKWYHAPTYLLHIYCAMKQII
jgi:hypothetical protein